jgi:outer membrane lipoprotein SlyB
MIANTRIVSLASAAALAAALAGCSTTDPFYGAQNFPEQQATMRTYPQSAYPNSPYPAQQVGYVEYGRITNVALIRSGARPAGNPAAGSVLGAVAGGLLGNTIGHGSGRAAATILGAVGGAAVGNRIAGGSPSGTYAGEGPIYRVSVQTDNGHFRTYDVSATGDLRPGDRVRIENGVIYLA